MTAVGRRETLSKQARATLVPALTKCLLLAEAVEKLGLHLVTRNERIESGSTANQSYPKELMHESILRPNAIKIVFQQPQPKADIRDLFWLGEVDIPVY